LLRIKSNWTKFFDGKLVADEILEKIKVDLKEYIEKGYRPPGLAAVLIGDNPASKIYVSSKVKTCANLGYYSEKVEMDKNSTMAEVMSVIRNLNEREILMES